MGVMASACVFPDQTWRRNPYWFLPLPQGVHRIQGQRPGGLQTAVFVWPGNGDPIDRLCIGKAHECPEAVSPKTPPRPNPGVKGAHFTSRNAGFHGNERPDG